MVRISIVFKRLLFDFMSTHKYIWVVMQISAAESVQATLLEDVKGF